MAHPIDPYSLIYRGWTVKAHLKYISGPTNDPDEQLKRASRLLRKVRKDMKAQEKQALEWFSALARLSGQDPDELIESARNELSSHNPCRSGTQVLSDAAILSAAAEKLCNAEKTRVWHDREKMRDELRERPRSDIADAREKFLVAMGRSGHEQIISELLGEVEERLLSLVGVQESDEPHEAGPQERRVQQVRTYLRVEELEAALTRLRRANYLTGFSELDVPLVRSAHFQCPGEVPRGSCDGVPLEWEANLWTFRVFWDVCGDSFPGVGRREFSRHFSHNGKPINYDSLRSVREPKQSDVSFKQVEQQLVDAWEGSVRQIE